MDNFAKFVKKNYVIFSFALILLSLGGLLLFSVSGKGTFSLKDDEVELKIQCPEVALQGEQVECNLLVDTKNKTISSINANYDLMTGVKYISFSRNDICEENCLELFVNDENGLVVINEHGVSGIINIGTLVVELSDDALSNQKYGVGLKNIEYVDTEILNSEMAGDDSVVSTIALENVSTDVRIKNNDATLSNIELSSGSLNETFDSDTIQYTANVDSSVDKISIQATANDGNAILGGTGLVSELNLIYGTNTFNIEVTAEDGKTKKTYTVEVRRAYDFSTEVYTYNKTDNYLYAKNDTDEIIITNLEPLTGNLHYDISDNKLRIININDEILANINIRNFISTYQIVNNNIYISDKLTVNDVLNNIISDNLSIKVIDNNNQEVLDKTKNVDETLKLKIYYNDIELDSYNFVNEFIEIDESVLIDNNKQIIKRILPGTTYNDLRTKISTNGTITITSKDKVVTNNDDVIKTGDVISIKLNTETVTYRISVLGDMDGDGMIKVRDVDILFRYFRKKIEANDLYDLSGDVNGDGTIKVRDVDILFRYFRKKISLEV